MVNKPRSDSRLAQLNPAQQAEIFRRLKTQSYVAVQRWLAQPPPEGFGIKTHINSLYRFFHRHDVNSSFQQSLAAALSPDHPDVRHRIQLAAIDETGRLIATNPNARAAFTLFSKQNLRSELLEIARSRRALTRERRQAARLRKSTQSQPPRSAGHSQGVRKSIGSGAACALV